MAGLVIVKFKVDTLPYASGTLAGFPAFKAAELVRDGRAVYCDEAGQEIFAEAIPLTEEEEEKAKVEVKEKVKEEGKEPEPEPAKPAPAPIMSSRARRVSDDKADKDS